MTWIFEATTRTGDHIARGEVRAETIGLARLRALDLAHDMLGEVEFIVKVIPADPPPTTPLLTYIEPCDPWDL